MERRWILTVIVGVIIVSLVGVALYYITISTPERLKVGGIISGSINDASWNAAFFQAMYTVGEEMDFKSVLLERPGIMDVDADLRDLAERGYNVIFSVDFLYQDAVLRVCGDYPDVWFIHINPFGVEEYPPNFAGFTPTYHEGGYLAGILAAGLTKTGKIGFIDGFKIPPIMTYYQLFRSGAYRVSPQVAENAIEFYTGSWGDITKAREAAISMIEAGVDVILPCGDGNPLGVIQAASQFPGVYVIGYINDMYVLGPDCVVTSNIWDMTVLVRNFLELYNEGKLENKLYEWGMKDGMSHLAPFYEHEDTVPQYIKDLLNETLEDAMAGRIEFPYFTEDPEEIWTP